jgi:catechol 2,3-dioxygenase-like lactoylglutathione lyase family enzyme
MTEFPTADWRSTVRWYELQLGGIVERTDPANGFVLVRVADLRIAFKQATPINQTAILHFETDDLDGDCLRLAHQGIATEIKSSDEGYRRVKFPDPDGRTVVLFEWTPKKSEKNRDGGQ